MSSGEEAPDWLSFGEARDAILGRCRPLEAETVALGSSPGRALAEDIHSPVDHPPWDNSAMDGFAVRAADVAGAADDAPVVLPVADEIAAGTFPSGRLEPGTAVKVTTGGPVPEGTTGVIRVEHTDGGSGGRVAIHRSSDAQRNIRRTGEDLARGDRVLRAGDTITPAAVGVLAMTGHDEVPVIRRPRVGVLATGDELAGPGEFEEVLAGRRIVNSNSPALAAQLRTAGAKPLMLGVARDEPGELREKVRAALESGARLDALLSTGGVSVGEHDHVRAVLSEAGMERIFWRVRVRPGTPLTFGLLPRAGADGRERPFWGLPGNPVSAMVSFEVFVRPAIRKMGGHVATRRRWLRARLRDEVRSRSEYTYFYRVRLTGGLEGATEPPGGGSPDDEPGNDTPTPGEAEDAIPEAELTGPQGSNILTSMSAADGLLMVPRGTERIEAGEVGRVLVLREWSSRTSAAEARGASRDATR